jgi:transcription antitermination protein NusB
VKREIAVTKSAPSKSGFNAGARRKARHYALQALYQWQISRNPLQQIENQFRAEYDFSQVDLELFQELLHQVPAKIGELEQTFAPFLDRTVNELNPIELTLLRMGCYELAHRIDVPFKVAINESVALAKKFGASESHKYINAVMDQLAKKLRAVEVAAEGKRG